jgi:Ser/Thr protein kinase RdoA (MazF antagonist)
MINAGEVNADQMYHLGQVTGRMHKLLSLIPQRKVDWTPNWDDLCHKWLQNWKKANVQGRSEAVIQGIESQRVILEQLDLSFFDDCEIGWTHWDLFVDNLLFLRRKFQLFWTLIGSRSSIRNWISPVLSFPAL